MRYDENTADQLEAVYRGADIIAQRRRTIGLLAPGRGERILDIGSGPGFLCQEIAEIVGPRGRVRGIDVSPAFVRRAAARNRHACLDYLEADATALPEADRSYDAVVSTQVAEYVPDTAAFCREAFRILRPGGGGRRPRHRLGGGGLAFRRSRPDASGARRLPAALRPQHAAAYAGGEPARRRLRGTPGLLLSDRQRRWFGGQL